MQCCMDITVGVKFRYVLRCKICYEKIIGGLLAHSDASDLVDGNIIDYDDRD